jgi:hypothetical protein
MPETQDAQRKGGDEPAAAAADTTPNEGAVAAVAATMLGI